MRIVCISDTHTYHRSLSLPAGDVLIHAGDSTYHGYEHEVRPFGEWLREQTHIHKVVIAGNHDRSFEDSPTEAREWLGPDVHYLQDSEVTLRIDEQELRIYGSPWQPWFHNWAFNIRPETGVLREIWSRIPEGLDILVTHGPPYGVADRNLEGEKCGDHDLRAALSSKRPKLHVCGHIHEGYGVHRYSNTIVANASSCNRRYNPIHPPLVFDFIDGRFVQVTEEERE